MTPLLLFFPHTLSLLSGNHYLTLTFCNTNIFIFQIRLRLFSSCLSLPGLFHTAPCHPGYSGCGKWQVLRINNIPLCICTTFTLFIHQLMNIWVISIFWSLINDATRMRVFHSSYPSRKNLNSVTFPAFLITGSNIPYLSLMYFMHSLPAISNPAL